MAEIIIITLSPLQTMSLRKFGESPPTGPLDSAQKWLIFTAFKG